MPIVMPTVVDDNGSGTTGTILDLAKWTALGTAIDTAIGAASSSAAPGTSAPTTTGTQTALAIPAGTGDLVHYLNNATLLTLQGIAAGLAGQRLTLISKGAGQVDLAHLHASGTALGKLKLVATTGLTSLAAGSGVAVLQYDATVTQWRLLSHEQGAPIAWPYASAVFTANTGTWTVDAGDFVLYRYVLRGRQLWVEIEIVTSTVSVNGAFPRVAFPSTFTALAASTGCVGRMTDTGGAVNPGLILVNTGTLEFRSSLVGGGFGNGAGVVGIGAKILVDVT